MTDYIVVETTTDTRDLAIRIAETLIEKRLAACVQIANPIESVYRWEGKVHREQEFSVSIKTRKQLFDNVSAAIRELHTYDEPQVIALEIFNGSKTYLSWIESETSDGSPI